MPNMIYICILLIYFKVISKKGSLLPPLTLYIQRNYCTDNMSFSQIYLLAWPWPNPGLALDPASLGPGSG